MMEGDVCGNLAVELATSGIRENKVIRGEEWGTGKAWA